MSLSGVLLVIEAGKHDVGEEGRLKLGVAAFKSIQARQDEKESARSFVENTEIARNKTRNFKEVLSISFLI